MVCVEGFEPWLKVGVYYDLIPTGDGRVRIKDCGVPWSMARFQPSDAPFRIGDYVCLKGDSTDLREVTQVAKEGDRWIMRLDDGRFWYYADRYCIPEKESGRRERAEMAGPELEGHKAEITDRVHISCNAWDDNILNHPTIVHSKKLYDLAYQIDELMNQLYQEINR